MRSTAIFIVLLAAATAAANAGSLTYGSPTYAGDLDQPGAQDQIALSAASSGQHPDNRFKQKVGLDGLGDALDIDRSQLKVYEYTSHAGTSAESKVTVGVGGRGVHFRMSW